MTIDVQSNTVSQEQKEQIELKVRETIAQALDVDLDDVQLSSSLKADLGAESLDMLDIAFMLEREFKIEFPRMDVLQRASSHFGEDAMIQNGVITDFGVRLMQSSMPELQREQLRPGMRATELAGLITVRTFARIVTRMLEIKQQFPRQCPACGENSLEESPITPEFNCSKCGQVVPMPNGDEVLFQDMLRDLGEEPAK